MRILFCNFEYPPLGGGGGVINALLAEELAKRHRVAVLTSRAADLPAESVENGVQVVRVPVMLRRGRAAASMVSMLSYVLRGPGAGKRHIADSGGYDVINTHFVLPSGPVGDLLARRHGIPNVLSVHGGDLYDPSKVTSPHRHPPLRTWIRRLVRRADAVVGQSRNTLENLTRIYTPDVEGVRIPLGIRRPPDGVASRGKYGLRDDEVLLSIVGRIVGRKAIHQLLDVVKPIDEAPVRLLILGEGPLLPALKAQAAEMGIEDRVKFLGRVGEEEKFHILRMSDLFVSTSQHEGFGLVFLEGMACGLPVICYNHGGQNDFLIDGVTGHLVELNDVAAFTARCRELVGDASRRKEMGRENLRRVEEFFIERCAEQYEKLFEEQIERAGRERASA